MINDYQKRLKISIGFLRKFIDSGTEELLKEIAASLIKIPPQKNVDGIWGIIISPDYPFKFRPSNLNGKNVQVDLFCRIVGNIPSLKSGDDQLFENLIHYNICVRVWSLDADMSFRVSHDSEEMFESLVKNDNKRVMLRFHVDKKITKTQLEEPFIHMHFGGNAQDNELIWYPKTIDVPRFTYLPLDIILTIEFILTNFFSEESNQLREDPEWKSIVITSQEIFLRPTIEKYNSFLDNDRDTFLSHTLNWN